MMPETGSALRKLQSSTTWKKPRSQRTVKVQRSESIKDRDTRYPPCILVRPQWVVVACWTQLRSLCQSDPVSFGRSSYSCETLRLPLTTSPLSLPLTYSFLLISLDSKQQGLYTVHGTPVFRPILSFSASTANSPYPADRHTTPSSCVSPAASLLPSVSWALPPPPTFTLVHKIPATSLPSISMTRLLPPTLHAS